MKATVAAALMLTAFAAIPLAAQSTTTAPPQSDDQAPATSTQPPAKPKESALVKAAQQSGNARKIPKKVITNADVKKSKGKLIVGTAKPAPAPPPDQTVPDPRTATEAAEAKLNARKAAQDRVTAAKTKFDSLEKDLAAIEQQYYREKDPNVRDTVIQQRFAQTKRQLESARKELADARDARDALAK